MNLRYIVFILVFLGLAENALGQTYLNSTCRWNVKDVAYVDLIFFNTDYTDYIDGKTTFNGQEYYKVYREGTSIVGLSPGDTMDIVEIDQYLGAIREEERKWYWIPLQSDEEELLYDFNLSEGDSLTLNGQNKLVLTLIDSIEIDDEYRSVFRVGESIITFIEGIGLNTRLTNPVNGVESISYIQCFEKDGEIVRPDLSEFEAFFMEDLEVPSYCNDDITDTTEENIHSSIQVFPNPFSNHLSIVSPRIQTVTLFDLLGQKVFTTTSIGQNLDLGHLQSGAYILQVQTNDHKVSQVIMKI